MSLKDKIKEAGYQVSVVEPDVAQISAERDTIGAYLIYGSDGIGDMQQALIYLKDQSAERDIPIFTVGSREENAKNAALPEPVTIEARIIIPHITKSMIRPPVPSMEAAALMIVVIPPVNFKPSAKTPAQIISATVEVNTLPIPEKKDFMLSQDFLKSRV